MKVFKYDKYKKCFVFIVPNQRTVSPKFFS